MYMHALASSVSYSELPNGIVYYMEIVCHMEIVYKWDCLSDGMYSWNMYSRTQEGHFVVNKIHALSDEHALLISTALLCGRHLTEIFVCKL